MNDKKTISLQQLEAVFINELKECVSDNNYQSSSPYLSLDRDQLTIDRIENRVALQCFGTPQQRKSPNYNDTDMTLDMVGKIHIRKLTGSLIFQGKLVPGIENESSLPWLTITPEGEQWLIDGADQDRSIFFSAEQYLERLYSKGVSLGDIASGYLVEAIQCYFNGCPRASMVMAGVSLEALFDELDDAWSNTTQVIWKDDHLESTRCTYSRRLDKFGQIIKSRYSEVTSITNVDTNSPDGPV